MKRTFLSLTLVAGLSFSDMAAGPFFNSKPLVDSIQAAIEKAVGAGASNRILGGYSYLDPLQPFQEGGIECPDYISDVKQATDLVVANLNSTFTNRIVSSMSSETNYPGGGSVVSLYISDVPLDEPLKQESKSGSGPNERHVFVCVKISFFKRPTSRVIIFPNYITQTK